MRSAPLLIAGAIVAGLAAGPTTSTAEAIGKGAVAILVLGIALSLLGAPRERTSDALSVDEIDVAWMPQGGQPGDALAAAMRELLDRP